MSRTKEQLLLNSSRNISKKSFVNGFWDVFLVQFFLGCVLLFFLKIASLFYAVAYHKHQLPKTKCRRRLRLYKGWRLTNKNKRWIASAKKCLKTNNINIKVMNSRNVLGNHSCWCSKWVVWSVYCVTYCLLQF